MKGFAIASVLLGLHVGLFMVGVLSGSGTTSVLAFCSSSLWAWPVFILAMYRIATGKAEKRPVLLNAREYEQLRRARSA